MVHSSNGMTLHRLGLFSSLDTSLEVIAIIVANFEAIRQEIAVGWRQSNNHNNNINIV
jgi:hypothetical protein